MSVRYLGGLAVAAITMSAASAFAQPVNDNFAAAITIVPASAGNVLTVAFNNTNATVEAGEPFTFDGGTGRTGRTIFYTFTSPAGVAAYDLRTANNSFDAVVGVYTGASLATLQSVAIGDASDGSFAAAHLVFNATPGQTYVVQVGNYHLSSGFASSFDLTSLAAPVVVPANDRFAAAQVLTSPTGTPIVVPFDNTNASLEVNEISAIGDNEDATLFYRYTASAVPPPFIRVQTSLGTIVSTTLVVFTGSALGSLTPIVTDGGGGTGDVTFTPVAGETYTIQVGGYGGQQGTGTLTLAQGADAPLPVELSAFTGSGTGGAATLSWATATERDNAGFIVLRAEGAPSIPTTGRGQGRDSRVWTAVAGYSASEVLRGHGTTSSTQQYRFTDSRVTPGKHYSYRLRSVDVSGQTHDYGQTVELTVGRAVTTPTGFALSPASPNPFNPSTSLTLTLPEASQVTVEIVNTLGQRVALLSDGQSMGAGSHPVRFEAAGLAGGLYLVRVTAVGSATGARFVQSERVTLVK